MRNALSASAEIAQAELELETDEALLVKFNLPDPDTLKMGDDFSVFMAQGVPTRLRNRALRKLWRSNPVLACVDGLNDYDDDYLTGSTGNGVIATTYKVGKGLMAHIDEMTRQAEVKAAPEPEPETLAEAEPEGDLEPEREAALGQTEDTPLPSEPTSHQAELAELTTAPKRMRFRYNQEPTA